MHSFILQAIIQPVYFNESTKRSFLLNRVRISACRQHQLRNYRLPLSDADTSQLLVKTASNNLSGINLKRSDRRGKATHQPCAMDGELSPTSSDSSEIPTVEDLFGEDVTSTNDVSKTNELVKILENKVLTCLIVNHISYR